MLLLTSAALLIVTGFSWLEYRDALNTSDALDGDARSPTGEMNILLIGLDSRKDQDGNQLPPEILDKLHAGDGQEGGYNTNTLILMHIPAGGGRATAFSIPRDDLVSIPGEHPDKIKKAYGYAKDKAENDLVANGVTDRHELESKSRDAGRRATLQVVRNLTGVPIDHFAEVNLAGFYHLATALGGVEVCLNKPVQDDYSGANFRAGRQVLDGSQALSFVRQRHGLTNGDLDRTRRQQAFLSSVNTKLRSSGTFTDSGKLAAVMQAAKQDVVIDSGWDVAGLAEQSQNITGGNMQFQTLPIQGFTNQNGEDANLVDPAQIRNIVRTAFGYQPPPPPPPTESSAQNAPASATTVDVLNGSGATGLAKQVSGRLTDRGFNRGKVSNAQLQTESKVSYHPGEQGVAGEVAQQIGGATLDANGDVPAGHVRVTLGTSFNMPSSAPGGGTAGTTPQAVEQPRSGSAPNRPAPAPATGATPDIPCVD